MHAIGFWCFKPVFLLVAAMLIVPAVQAEVQSLQAPKIAAADPKQVATAFSKTAPASITDLKLMEQHVKTLVTQVSPAVVAVEVGYGSGSGVVISSDGLVLTAGHVCERPNRDVRFTFPDGKTARGKTVGLDRNSDTGLMRITDSGPWPHAAMGEVAQARIGDWVLALGHPGGFDLGRSLVVRLGRIILLSPKVLQTDCTISPGDSGGPLFDMYGRVIGIHSAISSSVAQNFHVPVTEFYSTWDELVKGENRSRFADPPKAYFGATAIDDDTGCRLSQVDEHSPAFEAGLNVGDLVLRVEEREIKVSASFRRWVAETRPGETLSLEIKRGEEVLSLNVTLRPQPVSNP